MIEDLELLLPDQYQYHHAKGRICFGIQLMYQSCIVFPYTNTWHLY
jgi:hypothetical protein